MMTRSPFVLQPKELLLCLPLCVFQFASSSFLKSLQSGTAFRVNVPALGTGGNSHSVPWKAAVAQPWLPALLAGAYTATPIIYSPES